jgi:eukaryotic-like serine/threonine-protein kinase
MLSLCLGSLSMDATRILWLLAISMTLSCSHCSFQNPEDAQFCSSCTAPLAQILYTLPSGTHLAEERYRIDGVLGEGAFGITYKGMDLVLNRSVAIKELFPLGAIRVGRSFLLPYNLDESGFTELWQQFIIEGNCLSQLSDPNIVKVLARFEEHGTLYMVMEFVEGRTLHRVVKAQGPLGDKLVLHYLEQIGQALSKVHLKGFVHRDVKPTNILVTDRGQATLIDFGSVCAIGKPAPKKTLTPGFAPPEQYIDNSSYPTLDVYALASTGYFALTGRMPIPSRDRREGHKLVPPHLINELVAPNTEMMILQGMALSLENRPKSIGHFIKALV